MMRNLFFTVLLLKLCDVYQYHTKISDTLAYILFSIELFFLRVERVCD